MRRHVDYFTPNKFLANSITALIELVRHRQVLLGGHQRGRRHVLILVFGAVRYTPQQ